MTELNNPSAPPPFRTLPVREGWPSIPSQHTLAQKGPGPVLPDRIPSFGAAPVGTLERSAAAGPAPANRSNDTTRSTHEDHHPRQGVAARRGSLAPAASAGSTASAGSPGPTGTYATGSTGSAGSTGTDATRSTRI
jgi:hypothetical protein